MSTPSAEFGNRPLDQWKVTELKDELRRRKITTKGLKEDLIRRLEEAIRSDGENVNSGEQVDCYGSGKKEGDSAQDYYPGQNTNINYGSVPFQKNLNFNIKEEDESVAEEKSGNLDVSGEIGTAKGSENDYGEDNKVVREMVSNPKPSESNIASSHRALADVDGEEPKSEVQGIDDASGPPIKDAVPEESDSLHQVSEKVSPVVGFQLKCESVSTDSVSINEENELKDSLNADNVHLESVVKLRIKQESSDYVPHQSGDSRSLEEEVQAGPYQTEEGCDADDDDEAIDVDSSLKDDGIGHDEVRSPYRVDVTGNVTEESLNEDSQSLKRLSGAEEMESKIDEDEIPQVNSAREEDAVAMEVCQERKEKGVEDRGNDVGALGEKRKKEDLEAGLHEPAKRQRRWNSGNNLAVDGTKFTSAERERDLPRALETAHSSPSTVPITRDRPSTTKPLISRSDSMNNGDEQKERVVLPSQRPPTNSLRIDRFLRPFTLKAVQELLAKTGAVTHFWMDHIKTHCYVTYSSVDEAITTRNALYNLQWPSNGGRQLIAEYVDPEEVKLKIEGPPPQSPAPAPVNAPPLPGSLPYNHMPFKPPTQVSAGPPQHALPPPPPPPPPPAQLPPPPMPPSFVPPLIYAMMGSSRDLAVGTVAVCSLLLASMLGREVSAAENPALYLHLAFTAAFYSGIFQASLGIFRLGFVIDFLSHATIVGFMSGAATVVSLQQLKGILGVQHFTTKTDIVSVMLSVWGQTQRWRWESIVLGLSFLCFLLLTRQISKRSPRLFWISAAAPLASVIVGSLLVFLTHAERHGVEIVGHLKKGLNPPSLNSLVFQSRYLKTTLKAGLITGIISLTEGIAIGRTFSLFKNYHIDGNKEMIAIGMMNIAGSCTSCYITTGAFSRSAVNYNAGCKTAASNIVMATAVMITLLFLTPLFHYTPLVILSSIIISAMIGLIDFQAAYHLWKVDKIDFLVCMGAYIGVVFVNVEVGLGVAVVISMVRVVLHVSRPHTAVLGNIPNTTVYKDTAQYPDAIRVPGIFILSIGAPIYFANSGYLRERLLRWITEEQDRLAKLNEDTLQYVLLDMSSITTIDTSGIAMLEELKKTVERRGLQLVLSSPGMDAMEKLQKTKFIELLGQDWLFFTVGEAVKVCNSLIHAYKLHHTNRNDNIDNGSGINACVCPSSQDPELNNECVCGHCYTHPNTYT